MSLAFGPDADRLSVRDPEEEAMVDQVGMQTRRKVCACVRARAVVAVSLVGSATNETNVELVAAWRARGIDARLVTAAEADATLRPGEIVFARLDVLPTLDSVEPGCSRSSSWSGAESAC